MFSFSLRYKKNIPLNIMGPYTILLLYILIVLKNIIVNYRNLVIYKKKNVWKKNKKFNLNLKLKFQKNWELFQFHCFIKNSNYNRKAEKSHQKTCKYEGLRHVSYCTDEHFNKNCIKWSNKQASRKVKRW